MLWCIVRHEWRLLKADRTPWIALSLLALSLGYGLWTGQRWATFQRATLEQARQEEAARYDSAKRLAAAIDAGQQPAPFADPRRPDMAGGRVAWTYTAMPPTALAALSVGQSDVLPYYFRVSTAARRLVLGTNEIENPHRLLTGRFDVSFVVIYLYPLLIIALTYNVVAVEKEEGTLALLLSQPVSLKTFILGKVGLRAMLLLFLLALFSIIEAAAIPVDSSALFLLAFWVCIVAAYGAFWFGVVLLVASFARASATSALASSAIWLVVVIVLPSALNMAASALHPLSSRVDMIAAERTASDEATAKGEQLTAKYYGDHPELAGMADPDRVMSDVAVRQIAILDSVERMIEPVVNQFDVQLARQQALVDRFRLLSPAIVVQDGLNDVAGTGARRHGHFLAQVESFHREWRALFAAMVLGRQRLTPSMYDRFPRFTYQTEPLQGVLTRIVPAVIVLAGLGLLLGTIGLWRLRRYPVAG